MNMIENIMLGIISSIIFGVLNYIIYIKNVEYSKIIKEFKEKLPPSNKRASVINKEISKKLFSNDFKGLDVSTHKTSIDNSEIDIFFNKINNFKYYFVFFPKHYKSITKNLNRFNEAEAMNKNFNLVMIQETLDTIEVNFWKILWFKKIALKVRFIKYKQKFKLYMYNKTKNTKWLI